MTIAEWHSRAEFAAELKKVLNLPVMKYAEQIVTDFMSPTRLMLNAPDVLLGDKPVLFLGQIKGFEMRKAAFEALTGDVAKTQELERDYGVKIKELIAEAEAARNAAATVSKPKPNRKK